MSSDFNNTIISVVVCTYNRAELLSKCLHSLTKQTLDLSVFEVIVVDNNSTDTTIDVARQYAKNNHNFRVVSEFIQGHSHARNRGWLEAQGSYIAYLDDDAKATPDWCERILNAFNSVNPRPVAVGGQIHPFYEISPPEWFTDDFEIRTWGDTACFLEPPRACHGFSGSNMAIQRSILERFGGFSSRYGMVQGKLRMGEDAEFFFRIYDQEPGFWYDPLIKVYHWVPKEKLKVWHRIIRSYNAGQSIAFMQGKKSNVIDYLKCFAVIILGLLELLRNMPFSMAGIKREAVKFLEVLSCKLGFISVRK